MNLRSLLLTLVSGLFLISCAKSDQPRETLLNAEWKFIRADVENGQDPALDDSSWRSLDLPHDYSIEDLPAEEGVKQMGPFSEKSAGGASTGHVVGGTAWYRKHFTLSKDDQDKLVTLLFDGVYMDADIWINGHHLGKQPYGYTAFSYDLTPRLLPAGEENILAVQVKNEGKNSRWYSGSGIYRDVKLIKTPSVHLPLWGIYLTTPSVSEEKAVVRSETRVANGSGEEKRVLVATRVKNSAGREVAAVTQEVLLAAGASQAVTLETEVTAPALWSPDEPSLYTMEVEIAEGGKVLDAVEERFGIRSIAFSAEEGFLLNGEPVLLKGGCLHHDNGPLGSAAFRTAEFRRVKTMKEAGFNAIRTSHNPPSRHFLDACDALGMLVMDESFDHWQKPKNPQDYHRFFDEWWEKDIEAMVLRDRNHPSVIIWSVGNEIQERADSSGLAIYRMLSEKVKSLDHTRPVTQAVCGFWDNPGKTWDDTAPTFAQMDVHGYNYQWQQYEPDHARFPERIMIGTESVPKEAFENWQMVEKHPYVIGDFVWTGMDYLGESGIGHTWFEGDSSFFLPPWPWYNANCGDISITGHKKPQMFFRDVVWRNSPLEMMVHAPLPEGKKELLSYWGWPDEWKCWNWEGHEGKNFRVSVYTRCEQVRLELNGEVIGTKEVSDSTKLTAQFEVPYQSGELTAIGLTGGIEVARQVLKTTGKAFSVRVTPEKESLSLAGDDLAYFNVEILDENGDVVPDASLPVALEITGGRLQAIGNDNPQEMHSFQQPRVNSFRGRCQVIVRPEKAGTITVTVTAEGLQSGNGNTEIIR
ncbi:MAG TPA: glycoside hydrolase family 2 TIM barrel-domain containing protein [Prolixibacteraceae bacterium]|nr:glycoside hydrolase family 2 TIM barrel-domain containing protein [Prolixibacteraceae bacterium]